VFINLVHELAEQVPLGKLFRIDGTDIPVDHRDEDAEWNYDHAENDYYYGYGCCVVTAANNIPVAAAFTPAKKVDQETAMRVTPSVTLTTPFPVSTTAVSVGSLPTKQSVVSRPSVPSAPSSSRATTR
jgi:hypothetical protein